MFKKETQTKIGSNEPDGIPRVKHYDYFQLLPFIHSTNIY